MRPVHAPLAAERDDQFVAGEARPVAEVLAMALGEGVSVLAKSLGDEAAVGVGGVGDQQRTHGHYGTR